MGIYNSMAILFMIFYFYLLEPKLRLLPSWNIYHSYNYKSFYREVKYKTMDFFTRNVRLYTKRKM